MNYLYYFIQYTGGERPFRLISVKAAAPHLAWIKLAKEWSGRHMDSKEAKEYLEALGVSAVHPEEYE